MGEKKRLTVEEKIMNIYLFSCVCMHVHAHTCLSVCVCMHEKKVYLSESEDWLGKDMK